MKARRSRLASVVVAVLTSGWQLTVSAAISAGVEDHGDRGGRSLIRPNGVTEPGGTPSVSMRSSGLPKESRPEAPIRLCRCFRSIAASSRRDDQKERVLLVLEEQVLGVGARRSRRGAPALSSTVKTRRVLDRRRGDAEFRRRYSASSSRVAAMPPSVSDGHPLDGGRTNLNCWSMLQRPADGDDISRRRTLSWRVSGCSSGVEHNLAKVGVEGSNPFARSNFPNQ